MRNSELFFYGLCGMKYYGSLRFKQSWVYNGLWVSELIAFPSYEAFISNFFVLIKFINSNYEMQ